MAAVLGMTTAAGLLSLLDEPEIVLQEHAVKQLNDVVDVFWPEVADYTKRLYFFKANSIPSPTTF